MRAMKTLLLLTFGAIFCTGTATASPEKTPAGGGGIVYVIPIRDVIDDALLYVIRRGINEAADNNAAAIVFDMETPGGRVDTAEDILNMLRSLKIPTYALVNRNAISAGAIIAMATDHIYMTPSSKIGDAMPIMISMFGEVQSMPESIEEKQVSYVAAMIRAAAQHKGHNPELAVAMVRRDSEFKIGDEVISKKGHLLTLTNVDAERPVGPDKKPLLSEGTVNDLDELLQKIGRSNASVVELQVTAAEEIAQFIESISIVLLGLGLLGIYLEFKLPGVILPGALGALFLAIWFWGSHIAGLAGMEEIALFILGLILLIAEIFFIPGFGFLGMAGIAMMVFGILMGMVEHYPGAPTVPPLPEFHVPVLKLTGALVLAGLGVLLASRFLPKTSLFGKLVLQSATSRSEGFQAADDTTNLIGVRGVATTLLRPAGSANFSGRLVNVVTRGDFIEAGDQIVIVEAHGNRIIVERAKPV